LIQKPALRLEGAVATPSVPPAKFDERIGHGQRIIDAAFGKLSPRRIPAGTRLFGSDGGGDLVYRLSGGWACRAVDWLDGRRAIVEIYLPGDMVGLEAAVLGRPVDEIIAVTALAVQAIDAQMLAELMAQPPAAAAILWLRAGQQRRVDRLAAALARRDAHERLALMLVDLYDRLCERGLVTGSSYPLPLTQQSRSALAARKGDRQRRPPRGYDPRPRPAAATCRKRQDRSRLFDRAFSRLARAEAEPRRAGRADFVLSAAGGRGQSRGPSCDWRDRRFMAHPYLQPAAARRLRLTAVRV